MMTQKTRSKMTKKPLFAVMASLFTLQAYAVTPEVFELDEVSVIATRSVEKIVDQPLSIAKKGAEEVALDQVLFQKDLLNSIAGVNINQTGSVLGHKTAIRMPNSTSPYYLYLQDGVPVQSSGFFNHNGLAYTNFQTAGTTEVLKGAGTALYGSDSVAATINVQSEAPAESLERKVRVYTGSDGLLQGGFSVSDQLKNGSSYRLSGSALKDDGWRDHTASSRNELSGEYNFSEGDDDFKLSFSSNHSESEQAGSLIGLTELETNPTSVGDIESKLTTKLQPLGLDAIRKFDHNRVSLQWDNYGYDSVDLSTIFYLRNTRNQYTATWENNLPHNDTQENTLGVMHKGTMDQSWGRFIYGLDTELTQGTKLYTQYFTDTTFGTTVPAGTIYDYTVDYVSVSPYLHSDITLSDKTELSAGLRYDVNRYDYTNHTDDGVYATSNYYRPGARSDTYQHLSPKLSVNHKLTSDSMVYARYANGFRVPSASRLYSLSKTSYDFTLDPEVSNTFELGYKTSGKQTAAEVALYYMDIADTITQYTDLAGDRYYANGGTTVHRGLEVSLKHRFNAQWSTKLAYSYSMHNYVNDPIYGNNEMAAAPNNLVNLRGFYRPQNLPGLVVMAEAVYSSEYWMDSAHTAQYAGYKMYNLKADYQVNKSWNWFAKVNNLTDEIYAESATYSYGKEKYTPAAPRQIFIGAEFKW
ncbi:MAG: TonB-dependent receptor [Gammaproteobacteria bacterium]|nr:TonB-dependent receptor [Gammaproteobacteria bacterium]